MDCRMRIDTARCATAASTAITNDEQQCFFLLDYRPRRAKFPTTNDGMLVRRGTKKDTQFFFFPNNQHEDKEATIFFAQRQ